MKVRDVIRRESEPHPSREFLECLKMYVEGDFHMWDLRAGPNRRIMRCFDAEMPVLAKSYTVWRGLSLRGWKRTPKIRPMSDFRKRDTVRFPGYVSTSLQSDVADERLRLDGDNYRNFDPTRGDLSALFRIQTKPGARGIRVADYDRFYETEAGMEMFHHVPKNEDELILNRDAEFAVTAKRKEMFSDGKYFWYVDLQQIR